MWVYAKPANEIDFAFVDAFGYFKLPENDSQWPDIVPTNIIRCTMVSAFKRTYSECQMKSI